MRGRSASGRRSAASVIRYREYSQKDTTLEMETRLTISLIYTSVYFWPKGYVRLDLRAYMSTVEWNVPGVKQPLSPNLLKWRIYKLRRKDGLEWIKVDSEVIIWMWRFTVS